jgi:hypothetical protein
MRDHNTKEVAPLSLTRVTYCREVYRIDEQGAHRSQPRI